MMDGLIQAIAKKVEVDDKLVALLEAYVSRETIEQHQIIIKPDQHCRTLYFLEEGAVRTSYLYDGKDVTF